MRVRTIAAFAFLLLISLIVVPSRAGADDVSDWDSYWNFPFGSQQRVFPHSTTGHLSSDQSRCTATLITVDIVVTAGHCVHPGSNPNPAAYYDNIVFCPGWHYGADPSFGCFALASVVVTSHWYHSGNENGTGDNGADVGFVKLQPNGAGQLPGQVVGNLGVVFNGPRDEVENSQGYPGGAWGGNYEMILHADYAGTLSQNPTDLTRTGGDWCKAGGASGSPIFQNFTSVSGGSFNRVTHVLTGEGNNSCAWVHLGSDELAAFNLL